MSKVTPEQIDDLLPQTQCGLCSYGGCMPYAEAIVFEHAPINLCPPGGVPTLRNLGQLLSQNVTSYIPDMEQKAKPKSLAVIREAECIGCAKCIQACPVDAIIGSAKQMHSVIASDCTGCELCVSPCPVDCIDMIPVISQQKENEIKEDARLARQRFNARQKRLAHESTLKQTLQRDESLQKKQRYVEAAIARAKAKKQ